MDKSEAIERLEYLKAKAQLALEQEVPEWIAEDVLGTIEAYDMAIEALQIEPERGEWIDRSDGGRILNPWWENYECNRCGYYGSGTWNFCPNCGASMREREGE